MKYGLIYADPPWQYGNTISRGAADGHYNTMNLTELKRLPVWELAEDNSVLVMWYTVTHVEEVRDKGAIPVYFYLIYMRSHAY
jgi:N6-adenosine-specific RNA methylase IME4